MGWRSSASRLGLMARLRGGAFAGGWKRVAASPSSVSAHPPVTPRIETGRISIDDAPTTGMSRHEPRQATNKQTSGNPLFPNRNEKPTHPTGAVHARAIVWYGRPSDRSRVARSGRRASDRDFDGSPNPTPSSSGRPPALSRPLAVAVAVAVLPPLNAPPPSLPSPALHIATDYTT